MEEVKIMAKKYKEEIKEVLDANDESIDKIDPKAEAALKEQIKKEKKAEPKRSGGLRV